MTNSLVINTGYDGSGSAISIGTTDPYWTISALSTALAAISPLTVGANPYAVTPHPLWATTASNSRYVSCMPANGYNTNTSSGPYEMTIRRTFKVCEEDEFYFDLYFAGDDTVKSVSIDGGSPIYTNPGTWSASSFSNANTTLVLTPGLHTIDITLANWIATYTNNDNYFGIDVYGTVSSTGGNNTIVANTSDPECECGCGIMTNLTVCTDIIGNPLSYTFTPVVSPAITSFFIDFGDGSSVFSTGNTPINHTYASGGSYTIQISIVNASGEICNVVRYSICIPGSDGGAGKSTYNKEIGSSNISQTIGNPYPNPAHSVINVPVYGVGSAVKVVLVRLDGTIAQQKQEIVKGEGIIQLNTINFPAGLYYIKISDAVGQRVKSFIQQ